MGATDEIGRTLNAASRKAILAAATNGQVRSVVSRYGMQLGGARFVAGETLDECLDVLAGLNAKGLRANTTLLGEDVESADEARDVAAVFRTILDRIAERELRVNLAVKLTHVGLLIDEELAYENIASIVDHAGTLSNFVRIDMEHSALVDATLRIYARLRDEGRENVGTVLQSYLYRTPEDLEALLPPKPNLRLVKGAYLEPAEIAYPRKEDVDSAYLRLMERALLGGAYLAIATHDERMIDHAIAFADEHEIGRDRFEFQMLYGVRPQLQLSLVARGYNVLVATPYGPEWYPYLMRRLAERPANVLFIAKNLRG
ncbi:MAG TPA: proline dehydrogenase family protein [Gaiellaceae bacterium]|nr:proline dehydrogenase family protein [Gaiellaceae bacterium]